MKSGCGNNWKLFRFSHSRFCRLHAWKYKEICMYGYSVPIYFIGYDSLAQEQKYKERDKTSCTDRCCCPCFVPKFTYITIKLWKIFTLFRSNEVNIFAFHSVCIIQMPPTSTAMTYTQKRASCIQMVEFHFSELNLGTDLFIYELKWHKMVEKYQCLFTYSEIRNSVGRIGIFICSGSFENGKFLFK